MQQLPPEEAVLRDSKVIIHSSGDVTEMTENRASTGSKREGASESLD